MPEKIEFDILHEYNMFQAGITVETTLRAGKTTIVFEAKIDTGSTYCIFERNKGEALEIEIESGLPVTIGTATGTFKAFGHELELEVLGIKTASTVYFAESEYFDRNVLGRIGWLNKVKLGLIDEENKLYLSEYK
jgi:hypothetical protein